MPLWIKITYSLFLLVLIPNYLRVYGATNFLYFCDVAAFLTFFALWAESPLLASMAAVGILLPQMLWVLDFAVHFFGLKLTDMSAYMWNPRIPLFTRLLSLFHGWLPFFLLYLLKQLGYDQRAFLAWATLGCLLILLCYFWLPKPGQRPPDSFQPVNINYVYGFSDDTPQRWMPAWAWLSTVFIGLPVLVWWPTHLFLYRFFCSLPGK